MKDNEIKSVRPRGTDSAKVIQVIVTKSLEGIGTEEDPCKLEFRRNLAGNQFLTYVQPLFHRLV